MEKFSTMYSDLYKIRKPIFIKQVGCCIMMHKAPCKSGNHELKALKTPGLSTEDRGWCTFKGSKVKAEAQILLCGCSFALTEIWGQRELTSIHNIFFFSKLCFS